ncbi:SDR family NAD(P)-dependent oxidoreductase [Flavobacterium johnsoniae]|jgi:NAD(P)-dependent dehydrogenase (short-subunit alcohol dehydrogenase family)|uniref:Short-chain dehydrogenase n=2 Tax=Flavobacterium johnsoniae TaxID=986 RepID=A0A1M7D2M3_FLAJO|nr:SDR family NAD(P)-dependent oxidoreductase [Flavobacterium johnsoniae]ABQ03489.1 short-chain dehydrogenase/reductase SDR [Flavobacterium johnsoniae UW101]OXE97096.1 short-chain dehydrogenase [Flavobacterium johnsoniae UW101]WQG79648.1 SDR family NAD(P)-dependent oxidoreductase [Flavobacterium johnsoniae UW101]SHG63555.1 Short-chain dehydrogenase [Flavobacterium johnsoniae]SHL73668.1 Short-chain dehydrogenase [Flavobacterium johnsoniae]
MKNIIVTGTSRGIGYELALQFANAGNQVLAISRKTPKSLLEHQNVTCLAIDLADETALEEVEKFLSSSWKKVDALVHNAGTLLLKPFAETTQADFESIYKVNVFAVANLTRICLPYLQKGSHVVTISSIGGVRGSLKFAGLAAYSSSKGAVITLTELLAEEYKEQGISFNVLALGSVQTEMLNEAFPGYQAPISAEGMAAYIYDFTLNGNKYFNGKVLEVSSTNP